MYACMNSGYINQFLAILGMSVINFLLVFFKIFHIYFNYSSFLHNFINIFMLLY